MANSLLDFVMSLVRDPDAAARYAADPAQAIADANLTDVTSADVNNLIPVVSESLSMASPVTGADTFGPENNVWASGAATAAFDAFGDHVPESTATDPHTVIDDLIDQPDQAVQSGLDVLTGAGITAEPDPSLQFDAPLIDDVQAVDAGLGVDWDQPAVEDHHPDDGALGFDIFN
jgi:hypothetical protein